MWGGMSTRRSTSLSGRSSPRATHPYGRGINLEIEHPDPRALALRLGDLGITPYRSLRETTYAVDGVDTVQLAVLVQDPDGYLLRFARDMTDTSGHG